jgi:hypothetical protein
LKKLLTLGCALFVYVFKLVVAVEQVRKLREVVKYKLQELVVEGLTRSLLLLTLLGYLPLLLLLGELVVEAPLTQPVVTAGPLVSGP